jgi:hypothetical protein
MFLRNVKFTENDANYCSSKGKTYFFGQIQWICCNYGFCGKVKDTMLYPSQRGMKKSCCFVVEHI